MHPQAMLGGLRPDISTFPAYAWDPNIGSAEAQHYPRGVVQAAPMADLSAKMHLKPPHSNGHSAYEDIQAGWEVSYQAKSYHNAEIIPG